MVAELTTNKTCQIYKCSKFHFCF